MKGVFSHSRVTRTVVSVCLVASALTIGAQLPAKEQRPIQPNSGVERPERQRPAPPPSFIKRFVTIVFSDMLTVPKP
jgi:hypothetical protein